VNDQTRLLRQVHRDWVQDGVATSQAFRPTPKDQDLLSVADGDQLTPSESWRLHTQDLGLQSDGVLAVTTGECADVALPVIPDGEPYPAHVSISFADLSDSQRRTRSKQLRARAMARGWLYRREDGVDA